MISRQLKNIIGLKMLKRNEWNYNGYTWIHPDGRSLKTHVMLKAGEIKRIRTVASYKPQAASDKPQAASRKRQALDKSR
jgi:hypothetical protein